MPFFKPSAYIAITDASFREQALCRPHLLLNVESLRSSQKNDIGR